MHLGVFGTGRVGRFTLQELIHEPWITKLTLIDTKPGLAQAVEEEVRHALASLKNPIEIDSHEKDDKLKGADLVLVCAGTPRDKDMDSRTDLTNSNADIIKTIARATAGQNPGANFFIVTNPVDAMATYFKEVSGADWVISTGTNLETQRFKAGIARELDVLPSQVRAYVAGEHGEHAVFLWSSVEVEGKPLNDYLKNSGKKLDKKKVESYVLEVSRQIIRASGGTRHGPATSFRDIIRAVAQNSGRVFPVATPYTFDELDQQVMVSLPRIVDRSVGGCLNNLINEEELDEIKDAALSIAQTYSQIAKGSLE